MSPEALLPMLLAAHGAMGGFDTLVNHEIVERLPHRSSARREIGLHAIREAIYASLFVGLALFEWHGSAALAIAGLLGAEVLVTASDEWVENRTRVLPQNERVLHVLLTLNLGLIIAVLVPVLFGWMGQPTGLVRMEPGLLGWFVAALGFASGCWSLRDFFAWRRLSRARAPGFT